MNLVSSLPSGTRGTRMAWVALIAMVPAVIVIGLDVTVLSVALPTLATDLGASTAELQWFVIAYSISFAAAMIPAGLLGDRYGRKRVLVVALALFGAGSLACAVAGDPGSLIAARALLGVGAAGVTPMSLAIVTVLFDETSRPKATAALMTMNTVGMPIGPILGGWILSNAGWPLVFAINVPVVVVGIVSVLLLVPESRADVRPRIDLAGLALSSAALALLSYGITEWGANGLSSPSAWIPTLGGCALAVAFLLTEARVADPLVPLHLFHRRGFADGAILASVLSFAMVGLLFVVPQYTQAVLGEDTQGSGFSLLAFLVGMILLAPFAPRLAARFGRFAVILAGLAVFAAAMAVAAGTGIASSWIRLMLWGIAAGAGLGLSLPTAMTLAMDDLDTDASGVGSAILQAVRQVAGTIGTAALGGVLLAGYAGALPSLPADLEQLAAKGVEQGLAVAEAIGVPGVADQVRAAFLAGMTDVAAAAAIATVAGMAVYCARELGARAKARASARAKIPG